MSDELSRERMADLETFANRRGPPDLETWVAVLTSHEALRAQVEEYERTGVVWKGDKRIRDLEAEVERLKQGDRLEADYDSPVSDEALRDAAHRAVSGWASDVPGFRPWGYREGVEQELEALHRKVGELEAEVERLRREVDGQVSFDD